MPQLAPLLCCDQASLPNRVLVRLLKGNRLLY
jgi:hypothetical protein